MLKGCISCFLDFILIQQKKNVQGIYDSITYLCIIKID